MHMSASSDTKQESSALFRSLPHTWGPRNGILGKSSIFLFPLTCCVFSQLLDWIWFFFLEFCDLFLRSFGIQSASHCCLKTLHILSTCNFLKLCLQKFLVVQKELHRGSLITGEGRNKSVPPFLWNSEMNWLNNSWANKFLHPKNFGITLFVSSFINWGSMVHLFRRLLELQTTLGGRQRGRNGKENWKEEGEKLYHSNSSVSILWAKIWTYQLLCFSWANFGTFGSSSFSQWLTLPVANFAVELHRREL